MSVAPATMSEVRVQVHTRQGRHLWREASRVWNFRGDLAVKNEARMMLAVILVIVVGTIRLIGSNANNVFSQVASSIH